MIGLIKKLMESDYAYQSDDKSIYFNIRKFKDYGKLANINLDEQVQSDRVVSDDYSKDNPQDFVLWKSWKEEDGDVFWESPWGKGRPGWHIECSAMSSKYLGNHFDIHCGGVDNIFPHHENEIAQSECANHNKFVNYWLHSEHLFIDGGKMSKSVGNFYKIPDLIDMGFTPESLRYLLLSGHYRTKINFSIDKRIEALKIVQRINDFYDRLRLLSTQSDIGNNLPIEYQQFEAALDNDLNAPEALGVFFEWMRDTNSKLDNDKLSIDEINSAISFVNKFNSIFDLLKSKLEIPIEIIEIAEERLNARKSRDWTKSDLLRDNLLELGWQVEDTKDGYKLKNV